MSGQFYSGISRAMEASAKKREDERNFVHVQLEAIGPVVWLPDPEDDRFGVGWFRGDTGFFAHRRYANGWEQHRCAVLEDGLLLKLLPHMPKEGI